MGKKYDCIHCMRKSEFDGVFCRNCGTWDGWSFDRYLMPLMPKVRKSFEPYIFRMLFGAGFNQLAPKVKKATQKAVYDTLDQTFLEILGEHLTRLYRDRR